MHSTLCLVTACWYSHDHIQARNMYGRVPESGNVMSSGARTSFCKIIKKIDSRTPYLFPPRLEIFVSWLRHNIPDTMVSSGSGNDLSPDRRQAITWTKYFPIVNPIPMEKGNFDKNRKKCCENINLKLLSCTLSFPLINVLTRSTFVIIKFIQ